MGALVNPTILDETLVTTSDARKFIPGGVAASTVERWIQKGVKNTQLGVVFIGKTRYTSKEEIRRFLEAMNTPEATARPIFRRLTKAESEQAKKKWNV